MGAPIKINKDLLVITPNYTKKWLAEGQPKVSGLRSQVALPFAPSTLPVWACQKKACIYEQKIKQRDCPSAASLSWRLFCLQLRDVWSCLCLSRTLLRRHWLIFPPILHHRHTLTVHNEPHFSISQMYKMWCWQLWRISRCPLPSSPCWAAVPFLHSDKCTPLWRDLRTTQSVGLIERLTD